MSQARLTSKRKAGVTHCERCEWPLLVSAYRNGHTKCGTCYGIEQGYYAEENEADRLNREPSDEWLDNNRWFVEDAEPGGGA